MKIFHLKTIQVSKKKVYKSHIKRKIYKCFDIFDVHYVFSEVLSLLKIIIKKQDSLEKRIGQIENSVFNTESVILKDVSDCFLIEK